MSIADRTITVAAVGVTVGILDKHNRVIGMVTILSNSVNKTKAKDQKNP
jgi:hypothetical protein